MVRPRAPETRPDAGGGPRPSSARVKSPRARVRSGVPEPLDESGLMHLAGYATTLAGLAINKRFARQLGTLGLRMAEFSILVLVDTNPEVNQKSLGETLDISPPNLAVVLDRMAERGWVRRERSERDRRAHLIRLTPAGRALARRARRLSLSSEDEVLASLTAAERALLIELLHRLVRGARQSGSAAARIDDTHDEHQP
jgi:DNA-binding MarR family transcriptional regulator